MVTPGTDAAWNRSSENSIARRHPIDEQKFEKSGHPIFGFPAPVVFGKVGIFSLTKRSDQQARKLTGGPRRFVSVK
jgi:hypothetical protein